MIKIQRNQNASSFNSLLVSMRIIWENPQITTGGVPIKITLDFFWSLIMGLNPWNSHVENRNWRILFMQTCITTYLGADVPSKPMQMDGMEPQEADSTQAEDSMVRPHFDGWVVLRYVFIKYCWNYLISVYRYTTRLRKRWIPIQTAALMPTVILRIIKN